MKPTLREYVTESANEGINRKGRLFGYLYGALGAILFSMKAIFVKLAYLPGDGIEANEIDAISLMALRLGFSLPFYIAILWLILNQQKTKVEYPGLNKGRNLMIAGLLGVLGYYICAYLDITALKFVTAQLERLILFTYPVFVVILSAIFLGFRPSTPSILGIVIGYAGIIVIFMNGDITQGENLWLGTVMLLLCAICFAGFQLMAKPMISRLGSTAFTCCAMIMAGIVIFSHLILKNLVEGTLGLPDLPLRIWLLGGALALFSTLIPSFLVNIAIHRIGPQATAMLGLLSPVATIIFAIFWLGEPFGRYDAIGTLMTLVGIGYYSWHSRRREEIPPNNPAALQR